MKESEPAMAMVELKVADSGKGISQAYMDTKVRFTMENTKLFDDSDIFRCSLLSLKKIHSHRVLVLDSLWCDHWFR